MNLAMQPGVYALLLGSGISSGTGIPTGWGVVEQLVRMAAVAAGTPIDGDDVDGWWTEHHGDQDLGYSSLLEALGTTPASRSALLSSFFEADEEERAEGLKTPGPAHKAIAELVARGTIRVIITTNFDRLIEHALDGAGVNYQVIAHDQAVAGMVPLDHAKATIIKLNGDFTSLEQRNTVDELSEYPPATSTLLNRIFEDYGLVICGWSGDWDAALKIALESRQSRRYPLVWSTWGAANPTQHALTSGRGDFLVEDAGADEFFTDLVSRVQAIDNLAETPVSLSIKVARLRRALPDPVKHLEVRALFEAELEALRSWAEDRPTHPGEVTAQSARDEVTRIRTQFSSLLQLYAQGILLDRDQRHNELWVWVLQEAMDVRPEPAGGYLIWWEALLHLPAFLLLRVGVLAGLAARHETVGIRLCTDATWESMRVQQGLSIPAHQVLRTKNVLPPDDWRRILEDTEGSFLWPGSHVTRSELHSIASDLFGAQRAELALSRMEYRLALAATVLPAPDGVTRLSAEEGEYLLHERYRPDEEAPLALTDDFQRHGDVNRWRAEEPAGERFELLLDRLDERLRIARNRSE